MAAREIEDTISTQAVERELANTPVQVKPDMSEFSTGSLPEFMENYLSRYFASFGQSLPPAGLYDRILAEVEPALLRASLAATSGNQLRAAGTRNVREARGMSIIGRTAIRHCLYLRSLQSCIPP